MGLSFAVGNIVDQRTDALVNSWNRNLFPWWLLLPQGVSRSIKKQAGLGPFRELARMPMIPLGGAVATGAGRLPIHRLIHVAGIDLLWRGSPATARAATRAALALARREKCRSIAFPLIGAGSGGANPDEIRRVMIQELEPVELDTVLVTWDGRA